MTKEPRTKWLLIAAIALPGILLPWPEVGSSITGSWYDLGLPPGIALKIGYVDDPYRLLNFQPNWFLLVTIALWMGIGWYGCRTRRWAVTQKNLAGAFVQALLTSLYCGLLLAFSAGVVQVLWEWRLVHADWATLETAYRLARRWLPFMYILATVSVLTLLMLDAGNRGWPQKLVFTLFAIGYLGLFWLFSPELNWQLKQFDEFFQMAQKERSQTR